jgi:hypothetical protein
MPSPSKRLPWAVRLATHLYRLLIRLGPKEFLQDYEECMLSDFRRHCHEVYQRQGIWGLLRECSPMFLKAVVDMSEERVLCQKEKIREASVFLVSLREWQQQVEKSLLYELSRDLDDMLERRQSKHNKKGGVK